MHTLVILLTKAEDKDEAISNVSDFMENYGEGNVWDWYSIGDRWNNFLAPKDKVSKFEEWIKEEYKHVFKNGSYSVNNLENEKDKKIIQDKWEDLKLLGTNPYYDAFGFSINGNDEPYNIVKLDKCLDIVKGQIRDTEKEAEEYFDKMIKEKAENPKSTMSAYYAGLYKDAMYNDFSFETRVWNIDENEGEKIPENISDYYAVVVDMHN